MKGGASRLGRPVCMPSRLRRGLRHASRRRCTSAGKRKTADRKKRTSPERETSIFYGQGGRFFRYPSATSKIIIKVNPTAKPMVPRLECSPSLASGISSSTTT